MNSADAWFEDPIGTNAHEAIEEAVVSDILPDAWPNDPNGSLIPILEASVEEAKKRHPSASGDGPGEVLTAADRCDAGCGAGALFRMRRALNGVVRVLDFCHHHKRKLGPNLEAGGWTISGQNPTLMAELYSGNRPKDPED
jgi:hypothetical protein